MVAAQCWRSHKSLHRFPRLPGFAAGGSRLDTRCPASSGLFYTGHRDAVWFAIAGGYMGCAAAAALLHGRNTSTVEVLHASAEPLLASPNGKPTPL